MIKWLLVSLSVVPLVGFALVQRSDQRQLLLPGPTSAGHHQIEQRCEACHTPFAGVKQESCTSCHAAALEAQDDAHAPSKFDDPARTAQLAFVDARACVACHREHLPAARQRGSVSVPEEFCAPCHAEVLTERESHRGFDGTSCAATGCHNYHDNRALHVDVLRRHLGEPALKVNALVPVRALGTSAPPADAPAELQAEPALAAAIADWARSGHARAAVTCDGCHGQSVRQTSPRGGPDRWRVEPDTCGTCHRAERAGFEAGKHGMRLAASLTAMDPGRARLPMKREAAGRSVDCGACHGAHSFDVVRAAATACEQCHDDPHTRAYRQSPHGALWAAEVAGRAPAGSGVSCATCHLPREGRRGQGGVHVSVQHNQNGNLRPPDRMVRDVCQHCHGYDFALAAVADPALVARNFRGTPSPARTAMGLLKGGQR